jgi:hypothetical protein
MAYVIQLNKGNEVKLSNVFNDLNARIAKDGRFKCDIDTFKDASSRNCMRISRVRLAKAKPYCGNHPGECEIIPGIVQVKKVMSYLEWDDWVAFHNLVNTSLNKYKCDADVWSNPQDVQGKMWIRKGIHMRKRYDWDEKYNYGRTIREWNTGTPDQFV